LFSGVSIQVSTTINWTNTSVKALAGNGDPIDVVKIAAKKLVQKAKESGWVGPPFNPIYIAKMLGVEVVANSSISDARLLLSDEKPRIEFNPQQSRERMRFSIAHEIAHLLFPDWSEQVRNRGGTAEIKDDWQLEMLCNLAASEFVLPIGSLPYTNSIPSIEVLMKQCREFDVSVEAFLIRLVKTASIPIGIFVASPHSHNGNDRNYKVDYFISSAVAPNVNLSGTSIPSESIVKNCTAIGFTDSSFENWVGEAPVKMECVGIPGYPGSIFPRVAGIVRFASTHADRHPIKRVHGNVLEPRGVGSKIICQLVNDKAIKWGGGVARSAAKKFPAAQQKFMEAIIELPAADRLGSTIFSQANDELVIASLIAQQGYGKSLFPRIRYAELESCLEKVVEKSATTSASIHMPKIGTGAAGGDWDMIYEMIDDIMVRSGLEVTIYEPPPKRAQLELF